MNFPRLILALLFGLLGTSVVVHASVRVQVQLSDLTNVRAVDRGRVLVPEYTLPAGAIVEVSTDEYQQPLIMRFWDDLIGTEKKPEAFVRNIKLISAPGLSQADIDEFNRDNKFDPLYMSQKVLATAEVVKKIADQGQEPGHDQYRTTRPSPVLEAQDVTTHGKRKLSRKETQRLLDQMNQGNRSTKIAGTAQNHCDTCANGFFDRWVRAGVPAQALRNALAFSQAHANRIANKKYIVINDFSEDSNQKRMFILNTETGAVERHLTAHGKNSDPGNTGMLRRFGQSLDQTPGGFLVTAETYYGHHGYSLRMDGLERQNSRTRQRAVVIHPVTPRSSHDYMDPRWIHAMGKPGRSNGCLALPSAEAHAVIDKIKGGALIYNYAE